MNKFLLTLSFLILSGILAFGQTKISGIVKESTTQKEIYNLTVTLVETGQSVQTDRIGYFQFVDIPDGRYTLRVSGVGYQTLESLVTVDGQSQINMGELFVTYDPTREEIGVITLTSDELDADETTSQSAAGLLQSSRDVFARNAAFELGAYWFKQRGLDVKYSDVFFNGVRMNKISNGRVNFGDWGGLNDVTRYPYEQTNGIEPSDFAFGDAGGVTYYDTRPSRMRKGTSLAYSYTNRSYNQRVLATYNTGLSEKGWGVMFSGARRWAREGVIDGTFYDSWAYYLGVEKKINDKHTVTLTTFAAPTRRSTNSPNTQETYDLMGKDYNSYWGWQDGKRRSERVRKFFQPVTLLTHYWTISPKSSLTTTLGFQTGKDRRTRLDWFKAENPSPTYYRRLPSYYESIGAPESVIDAVTHLWENDQDYSQINWSSLYEQNRNRKGGGAAYILASDVVAENIYTFSTLFKSEIDQDTRYVLGFNYQNTDQNAYRQVEDLLGGSYFVNYNDFQQVHYNLDELGPDGEMRKVYKGDKYQYHYKIQHQRSEFFTQVYKSFEKLDITLGGKIDYTSVYRDGKYRHEQYPDHSKGKSKTYDFWNFGVKGSFLYKIDGRNFIQLNSMYATYAPTVDEIFPNARSNDFTIDNYTATIRGATHRFEDQHNLKNIKVFSNDISYILRSQRIKGRVTGYYTRFYDEYKKNFGFIDVTEGTGGSSNLFGAEYLYGMRKLYFGGELGVEAQITTTLTLTAVASVGQFTYDNNPQYQRFSDSNYTDGDPGQQGEMVTFGATEPLTSYLKKYHLGVGPQKAFSLGFQYRDPKFWWVGATANALLSNYLEVAPFRRTIAFLGQETASGFEPYPQAYDEELVHSVLKQGKFSDEFMLNINAGKTFRIGKYFMGISANLNNVFNNRKYVTGGFEQIRMGNLPEALDADNQVMFGPKLWYDRGRSFFINAFFRF